MRIGLWLAANRMLRIAMACAVMLVASGPRHALEARQDLSLIHI